MTSSRPFSIETQRLRLRSWRADAFAQLNADTQVMRYFPSQLTQTKSNSLTQKFQQSKWLGLWGG